MGDPEAAVRAATMRAVAAQRAAAKLYALHGWWLAVPGTEVCACAAMPVNHFYRGDALAHTVTLRDDGAEEDAALFLAGGFDSWVIACPSCRRVYAFDVADPAGAGDGW